MISIIAAIGKNNELGLNNKLIWSLPNDLKFFKEKTLNHKVIMGYNTYLSINKPLKDRENIVLTQDILASDYLTMTKEEVIEKYLNSSEEVFIIGGAETYKYFLRYAKKIYLTEIDAEKKADVYFPNFNKDRYVKTFLGKNEDNNIIYTHILYEKKGKLFVIEGTDCSGKETQSNLLMEKLIQAGYSVFKTDFPKYETPTGKIIGGPYLGKSHICDGWFKEGATEVDPLVASCYYAADRRYNINIINDELKKGKIVILDRYVASNMGHQGGKLKNKAARIKMYEKLDVLEYEILELPRPDKTFLLHMPYEYAKKLKQNRCELDQHEANEEHLILTEKAYLELAEMYNFHIIECVKNNEISPIEKINQDLLQKVLKEIKTNASH